MTTFRRFSRLSAALFALAPVALPLTAAQATATPIRRVAPPRHMLFKVRGKTGATVYLLGSVHLLTPEAGKLPPEIDAAFDKAKTVAFETSLDTVQLRAQEMLAKARYASGTTLKSSLSAAAQPKIDSLLHQYGLTLDQVNAFKPWFVSIVLTQMVMQKAGFQPQFGVDMQLNERAKTAGKPVVGLETVDFQLGLFDSINAADQESMLTSGKGPEQSAKELAGIKDAWLEGNTVALDSILNHSRDESPGLMAAMLTNRNRSWIPKIEQMLAGKEDVLVVVGAAHLVGNDGVLQLLRAKGYTVEQL